MQFKGINYCDFCFTPLSANYRCSNCGLTHATYHHTTGLLAPGANLNGKYIIGRVLGRGGFGATYIAYSALHGKAVAIKEYFPINIAYRAQGGESVYVVSPDKKKIYDAGAQRFYEEAQILSKFIGSQNVVSVYEYFSCNNTAYYSMEYLDGIDLKRHIRDFAGRLSEAKVIKIMTALCNALMVVHGTRTLHRDISPDNVYLCKNGDIKLIDFGAAKQVISNAQMGYSIVLKQGFAPPEQYKSNGNQGPWTDIYGVGATGYYALTGKTPPNAMERIETPFLPFDVGATPSPMLERILYKCMALKECDRYQSAVELLGDLIKINTSDREDILVYRSAPAVQSSIVNEVVAPKPIYSGPVFVDEEHMDEMTQHLSEQDGYVFVDSEDDEIINNFANVNWMEYY